MNRRIRAIGKQLRQLPALAELWQFAADFDPDRADVEPLDNSGLMYHGMTAALGGPAGSTRR